MTIPVKVLKEIIRHATYHYDNCIVDENEDVEHFLSELKEVIANAEQIELKDFVIGV